MLGFFLRFTLRLAAALVVASLLAVLLYRAVDPPLTPLIVLRSLEAAAAGAPIRPRQRWVPLARVSPALRRAVIAAEDARFLVHRGIDLEAVREARAYNARHGGRRLRGASTITMQCARTVFLWPGRTWIRKAFEAYLALLLEAAWGKRRILEVYLNLVEWGPGIYGAEAAAQAYFGVPAARLGLRQAALLAAALPDPRRWSPAAPTPYLGARAAAIARRAAGVRLAGLE
jgi:monofunctional biosynthetic peptidoglycan transglycosylase